MDLTKRKTTCRLVRLPRHANGYQLKCILPLVKGVAVAALDPSQTRQPNAWRVFVEHFHMFDYFHRRHGLAGPRAHAVLPSIVVQAHSLTTQLVVHAVDADHGDETLLGFAVRGIDIDSHQYNANNE